MAGKSASWVKKILMCIFSRLLNLYPGLFRSKFGSEMQAVFRDMIVLSQDSIETAAVSGRELRDLPVALTISWLVVL
jgi:hypothetical protein